jgi:hypothetical protein
MDVKHKPSALSLDALDADDVDADDAADDAAADDDAPPQQQLPPRQLKWAVSRTQSHRLPVYTDYRNKNTVVRKETLVRRVRGDVQALRSELQSLVGPDYPVTVHTGCLRVKGIHTRLITQYLARLGF